MQIADFPLMTMSPSSCFMINSWQCPVPTLSTCVISVLSDPGSLSPSHGNILTSPDIWMHDQSFHVPRILQSLLCIVWVQCLHFKGCGYFEAWRQVRVLAKIQGAQSSAHSNCPLGRASIGREPSCCDVIGRDAQCPAQAITQWGSGSSGENYTAHLYKAWCCFEIEALGLLETWF